MEASFKFFNSPNINRQLSPSIITIPKFSSSFLNLSRIPKTHIPATTLVHKNRHNLLFKTRIKPASCVVSSSSSSSTLVSFQNSNPLGFLVSFLALKVVSKNRFDGNALDQKKKPLIWNRAPEGNVGGFSEIFGERGPVITVVLLGWLGAKEKNLKGYAQFYASQGFHTITFVVPVQEVLGFDLGERVKQRVMELTDELVLWLSGMEEDGRERCLIFHTFSNTGWLTYGGVLDNLRLRSDLLEKIKGCVVDSGADPELNPQTWAVGYSTALLKRTISSIHPLVEDTEVNRSENHKTLSKMEENKPSLTETLLQLALENFLSIAMKVPCIYLGLNKVILILSKKQPPCPQLYLYSTADNIISFRSIESFIENQKKMGRKVWAYKFGSSSHVNHYRTFPRIYLEELNKFLKECSNAMVRA